MEIKDGIVNERFDVPQAYEAILKVNERDGLITQWEERIEVLQDELDEFNALTDI